MNNSLIKDTGKIFILSLIAKFIGFLKSIIQASFYGATIETDAYNMASGIVSNILYMLATAIAAAFVPIYIQKKTENHSESRKFSTIILTVTALFSIVLFVFFEGFAPFAMKLAAPSYVGEIFEKTVLYFRVLAVSFVFMILVSLYQNLLNAEKVYGYASVSSIINSVVLIGMVLGLNKVFGIWALVVAVPVSYAIQFIVLSIRGRKYGTLSFRYGLRDEGIKLVVAKALPILISQATVEINQVIDRALLSNVEYGAVTAVSYSATLYQFASGILILPISTVIYTELSENVAKKQMETLWFQLNKACKMAVLVCLPVMMITSFVSKDIVYVVYGHGRFDDIAVNQTAVGLFAYIFCLIPAMLKSVISKAYYALNNTKSPMILGVMEVILNITLSVLLVKYYGILGVVGATAIASFVLVLVMMVNFKVNYFKEYANSLIKDYWRIAVAIIPVFIMLFIFRDYMLINYWVDFITKAVLAITLYGFLLTILHEPLVNSILKELTRHFK